MTTPPINNSRAKDLVHTTVLENDEQYPWKGTRGHRETRSLTWFDCGPIFD